MGGRCTTKVPDSMRRTLYNMAQQTPSPDEIRAGMKLIVAHAAFLHSPMLTAFLSFVVDTTLNGRGERLKAYTIALDGLGRDAGFNPDSDAGVRVHAFRVRRA